MGAAKKHDDLVQVWESLKSVGIPEGAIEQISKQYNITEKVAAVSVSILKKVACSGTYEDFVNYIETRELPALKLTPPEMEAVKGGKNLIWPPKGVKDILGDILKPLTTIPG
jgi:hypothetical protein